MVCDWLWDYFAFRSFLLSEIAMKKKIRRLCAILAVLLIMILLVIGVRKYAHEQFLASFEIVGYYYVDAEIFYQEIYVNGEFLMYGIQLGIDLEAAP